MLITYSAGIKKQTNKQNPWVLYTTNESLNTTSKTNDVLLYVAKWK